MEVNCGSLPLAISFLFRPTPSCRLSHICLPQNNPPPPGRGTSRLQSVRKPAMTRSACFPPYLVRLLTSFAIASSCSLLLASGCFRSFPLASAHLRRSAFRPAARYEKRGEDFVSPVPRSPPASIDIGKAGRGCRIAGLSPSRLFCLSCLLAAFSFPYKPGMVMGYSVATVIYFS